MSESSRVKTNPKRQRGIFWARHPRHMLQNGNISGPASRAGESLPVQFAGGPVPKETRLLAIVRLQRNATLSVGSLIRSAYLLYFSQPAGDRALYKALKSRP